MGIYLGQLPPAEVARFKAELAETLIANFCYPRFFDQRVQALRMRPVDRAKRQEVWLYLSSVDFTQWSRIDLLSPDFQVQIERLFIQFVQRNRAFFGEQGRRRMSDIRMLIGKAAGGVAQGLRAHLSGQKGTPPFGSPRPVVSWATMANGRTEIGWEQISASTILLQQQLQEARGEVRPATATPAAEQRPPAYPSRRSARSAGEPGGSAEQAAVSAAAPAAIRQMPVRPIAPMQGGRRVSSPLPAPAVTVSNAPAAASAAPVATPNLTRRPDTSPVAQPEMPASPFIQTGKGTPLDARKSGPLSTERSITASRAAVQARPVVTAATQDATMAATMTEGQTVIGEDVAIFDQMRHQLVVWLRVEAVTAGIEIGGLSPSQLLDALRQQGRQDETRLQVVSSLLNLANQVIKAGTVSLLDYKQALMLHLMHTRR